MGYKPLLSISILPQFCTSHKEHTPIHPPFCDLILAIGLVGETIADQQLSSFLKNPSNKGKVCEIGLWSVSRHPNYFFEWVIWLGISFAGSSAPFGEWSFFSCLFIYVLLRYVSGVPMAEKFSLESKGDLFRDYQRRVSAFFPFPPKS